MERRQTMRAFGAELVLTPQAGSMELARDPAEKLRDAGRWGRSSTSSPIPTIRARTTKARGPRSGAIPRAASRTSSSSMGTTGTIMGCSRFLKEKNPAIQIIGAQPDEGSQIPGIRKWPEAYLPKIYEARRVDRLEYVSQAAAEDMTRRLAREEGIFCGISSGGALAIALRVSQQVQNAVIVFIVCDRGDRYLSTGVFPA